MQFVIVRLLCYCVQSW